MLYEVITKSNEQQTETAGNRDCLWSVLLILEKEKIMAFTFAHNNLNVLDLEKSIKFYEEALGLRITSYNVCYTKLLRIGNQMELMLGKWKYLILYFASGIIAGTVSIVYNMIGNTDVLSIGASGAIFGVIGAMLGIV